MLNSLVGIFYRRNQSVALSVIFLAVKYLGEHPEATNEVLCQKYRDVPSVIIPRWHCNTHKVIKRILLKNNINLNHIKFKLTNTEIVIYTKMGFRCYGFR